jgi:hypothetical protein
MVRAAVAATERARFGSTGVGEGASGDDAEVGGIAGGAVGIRSRNGEDRPDGRGGGRFDLDYD